MASSTNVTEKKTVPDAPKTRFIFDGASYEVSAMPKDLAKRTPIKLPCGRHVAIEKWLPLPGKPAKPLRISQRPAPQPHEKTCFVARLLETKSSTGVTKPPYREMQLRQRVNEAGLLKQEVVINFDDMLDYTRGAFNQLMDAMIVHETVKRAMLEVLHLRVIDCVPGDEKKSGQIKIEVTADCSKVLEMDTKKRKRR